MEDCSSSNIKHLVEAVSDLACGAVEGGERTHDMERTRSSQPRASLCRCMREKIFMPKRMVKIAVKGHVAAEAWYVLGVSASRSAMAAVRIEKMFRTRANEWTRRRKSRKEARIWRRRAIWRSGREKDGPIDNVYSQPLVPLLQRSI